MGASLRNQMDSIMMNVNRPWRTVKMGEIQEMGETKYLGPSASRGPRMTWLWSTGGIIIDWGKLMWRKTVILALWLIQIRCDVPWDGIALTSQWTNSLTCGIVFHFDYFWVQCSLWWNVSFKDFIVFLSVLVDDKADIAIATRCVSHELHGHTTECWTISTHATVYRQTS